MCDRKSSRRHGKRESSSRSSESGSRSADGAAPEVPIVIPDGKEFAARESSGVFGNHLQLHGAMESRSPKLVLNWSASGSGVSLTG